MRPEKMMVAAGTAALGSLAAEAQTAHVSVESAFTAPNLNIVNDEVTVKTVLATGNEYANGALIFNTPIADERLERVVATGCTKTQDTIGFNVCADGVFLQDEGSKDYYTAYAARTMGPVTAQIGYDNFDSDGLKERQALQLRCQ